MRKIFEQYGGVIVVTIAIVSLIGIVSFLVGGTGGGQIGAAYSDVVTKFSSKVAFPDDSAEVVTDYTLEEIAADEHLYAIGKTQPEYVVAKFNDDYSNVTITKNGENSDGVMIDWTSNSKSPSPMRANRSTLTSAIIKEGVMSVGDYAFYECSYLNSIDFPESLKIIGEFSFDSNSNLFSITLPKSIYTLGIGAFKNCKNAEFGPLNDEGNLYLPNLEYIGNSAFSHCDKLLGFTVPIGVTEINSNVFYHCDNLKNVNFLGSPTKIGNSAFKSCFSLSSIKLPDSIKEIGNEVFYECSKLSNIVLPKNLISLGNLVFKNCELKSITIPKNVTKLGNSIFLSCDSLEKILVEKGNESYKSIDGVLYSIDEKVLVAYPAAKAGSEYVILPTVTRIVAGAFNCCKLESVELSDNIEVIEGETFSNADKLLSITVPNNVTKIEDNAFANCTSLKEAILPDTITHMGRNSFKDTRLKKIIIPSGMTSLTNSIFWHSDSLSEIVIPKTVTSIDDSVFKDCPIRIVYGETNSYAETWATNNGYTFVAI